MRCYILLIIIIGIWQFSHAASYTVICYYDTFSINRPGTASFTTKDLTRALPLCNVVVYGYIGLHPETFEVITLHPLQQQQFANVRELQKQYRNARFFVSLGGDKDQDENGKYLKLLQADVSTISNFIESVKNLLLYYQFDGIDLAYQLPKAFTHPNQARNATLSELQHQNQQRMTKLIRQLALSLRKHNLKLSLTVLPNVQTNNYYNVTGIIDSLDFVTLAAFDFSFPQQTPKEAHYLAPIYVPNKPTTSQYPNNVLDMLQQWTEHKSVPTYKLYLGITAHGRTWNVTDKLRNPKMPIREQLNGPAPGGVHTREPGLLAWPEICKKLPKLSKVTSTKFGNYAHRGGLRKGDQGMLLTYESRKSIVEKVNFARNHDLGGVSFFDLTADDYRGRCWGKRYREFREFIRFVAVAGAVGIVFTYCTLDPKYNA